MLDNLCCTHALYLDYIILVMNLQDDANIMDAPETDVEREHSDHETGSEQSADDSPFEKENLTDIALMIGTLYQNIVCESSTPKYLHLQ